MSLRAYSEINLHITWHVKDNSPILTDLIESHAHRFLRGQAFNTHGVIFHGVGGTDDHIHLVVSVSPTVPISEWIGRLKGGCSHFINHEIANRKVMEWQPGFGGVCFGTQFLPWVLAYVENQRRRHAEGKTFDRLERTEPEEEPPGQGPGPEEARWSGLEEERGPPTQAQRAWARPAFGGRRPVNGPGRTTQTRLGLRYRLHAGDLPGKPDLVFRSRRTVVFVHGCYWHVHKCKRGRSTPMKNAQFWKAKRERNRKRDGKSIAALRRAGWRVIVVWECELKASKIERVIKRLQAIRQVGLRSPCAAPGGPKKQRP